MASEIDVVKMTLLPRTSGIGIQGLEWEVPQQSRSSKMLNSKEGLEVKSKIDLEIRQRKLGFFRAPQSSAKQTPRYPGRKIRSSLLAQCCRLSCALRYILDTHEMCLKSTLCRNEVSLKFKVSVRSQMKLACLSGIIEGIWQSSSDSKPFKDVLNKHELY